MVSRTFPAFRELVNGRSRFRIASPTEMMEVQRVGTRFLVHHLVATTYPERLRIHDLLTLDDPGARACNAADFEAWRAQAS